MPSTYEWKTEETKKLVGHEPVVDSNGQPVLTPKGKPKMERRTTDVKFEVPRLSTLNITSLDQLSEALAAILAENKVGFQTLRALVEHFNYGMVKSIARVFNTGSDIKYSASQLNAIKLYRNCVQNAGMPLEMAVELLQKQGVDDAESALAISADVEEEEEVVATA